MFYLILPLFLLISIVNIDNLIDCSSSISNKHHQYSYIDYQPLMIRRRLIWRKQFAFDDLNNWQPLKRLPKSTDKLVLPENYAVFLNRPLIISELILPENGELILSKDTNGVIEFSTEPSMDTQYFLPSVQYLQTNSWFNPQNWHVTFDFDNNNNNKNDEIQSSSYQISTFATFHYQQLNSRSGISIIPDSERIPCRNDFVDFPTNGTWQVRIDDKSNLIPSIASLTIGNSFTSFQRTELLQKFLQSFIGQLLFSIKGYNHMHINNQQLQCRGSEQCSCGNDYPKIMKEICSERKCLNNFCYDGIRVPGFCCPICGTSLIIQIKQSKDNEWMAYNLMNRILQKLYQQKQWKTMVNLYLHWLYDNRLHVVLTPIINENFKENPLINTMEMGKILHQKLLGNDLITKFIKNVTINSSKKWIIDSATLFHSIILNFFILMIILIIIIITTILCFKFHQQKNYLDPAFTFVRFRTSINDIEMEFNNDIDGGGSNSNSSIVHHLNEFPNKIKQIVTDILPQQQSNRLRNENDKRQGGREFENPIFKLTESSHESHSE